MTRAYRAINGIHPRGQSQIAAQELYAVQRLISCTTGAITILYALSKVNIAIVLILLIGGLYMMRWSMRHERQFIDIHYDQTVRQRQRDYWDACSQNAPMLRKSVFLDWAITCYRHGACSTMP